MGEGHRGAPEPVPVSGQTIAHLDVHLHHPQSLVREHDGCPIADPAEVLVDLITSSPDAQAQAFRPTRMGALEPSWLWGRRRDVPWPPSRHVWGACQAQHDS